MFQVDVKSRVPLYEQLYSNIRHMILECYLKEDDKLPSVRELASLLAINPNTIQKAFRKLEQEGYIYVARGKGNFVRGIDMAKQKQEQSVVTQRLENVIKEAIIVRMTEESVQEVVKGCYREGKI